MTINVAPQINTVPLTDLHEATDNVRSTFYDDTIGELAASIAENGLLNPLTVVASENGWTVIAGNRRLRALKLLVEQGKLKRNTPINVIVSEAQAEVAVATMLVENLQREDISPIDEAKGYLRLADEFKLKQKEIAAKVGKAASHITKRLALLRLPEDTQAAVVAGVVSLDVAYDLTRITDAKKFESLCKAATNGRLQSFEISSALRQQERLEDAARLSKWLDAHQIEPTKDRPNFSETEFIGSYTAASIKDYTPARGHIIVRASDTDDRVSIYKKLTPKQVEAKQAEQAKQVEVDRSDWTPLDVWQDKVDTLEAEYTEAMQDWQRRCDEFAAEAVLTMASKDAGKLAMEIIVHEAMNNLPCYRVLEFLGLLPEDDTTPVHHAQHWREVMNRHIDGSPAKAIQFWIVNRALVTPIPNLSTALDKIGTDAAAAAGLVEPTLPDYGIEPWQDSTGEWVTDRPYEPELVAVDDEPAPDYEDVSQDEDAA